MPLFEPVQAGLQNGPGLGADLIPDDDVGDVLLPHPFWGPLSLAAPCELVGV